MSAIKKQTALRWTYRNERSPGGAIIATYWTAKVGRFVLEVVNWPGTSTLDWTISVPGTEWATHGNESRYEFTVASLKDMVCEKAEKMES